MTINNYQLSLTTASQNLAAALSIATGNASLFSKLRLQLIPAQTGPFLVSSGTAAYSATGPGTFRTNVQEYFIEDQSNKNSGHLEQYNVSGAHAGDVLNIEIHQA